MEMTTPVITDAGQGREGKMTFPIEERMGEEPDDLPEPLNARYFPQKQRNFCYFQVCTSHFSGMLCLP